MGQPFPHYQQAQIHQGLPGYQPQLPVVFGQPAGMDPLQAAALAQGVDPRMLAQAQQQVADPNGGDLLNIVPGPREAAIGAAAGLGTAYGLAALMGPNYDGAIPVAAQWLDNLAWIRKLTDWTGARYQEWGGKHPWLREAFLTTAASAPKGSKDWQRYAEDAVSQMEKRHIEMVMKKLPNRFNENLKKAYENSYLNAKKADIIKEYNEHVKKNFAKKVKSLKPDNIDYQEALKALENGRDARLLKKDDALFNFAKKDAEWLKHADNLTFDTTLKQAKAQMHYLENVADKLSPEENQILQRLRGVKQRIIGLQGHYKPAYEAQAKLTAKMAADGVGPVGQLLALSGQYLQRIFNGDTLSTGSQKLLGIIDINPSMFGPIMAGGFIFGMSAQKATNAKEGEKTKTFFHDFFGTGIANFVGWELGRKWLNSSGIIHKVFGRFGTKRPFDNPIGSRLPIFGERFGKGVQKLLGGNSRFAKTMGTVMGKGLGGFFAGLTLGGLATELIAMFAFGGAFQFVGEKIAHGIFGKPSQESIDGKGQQQPQAINPQMTQQAGMAYNPAMAAAARFHAQNTMPGQAFAPQLTPEAQSKAMMPSFSLSPAQIIDNPASKSMQSLENSIMRNHATQQKKNNGRTPYFDPDALL
jgi:hypothetical protein